MPEFAGRVNRIKQNIEIRKGLPADQRHETLLHEVLHAIDGELIIGLEEEDICRLAVALYASGWRHAKG